MSAKICLDKDCSDGLVELGLEGNLRRGGYDTGKVPMVDRFGVIVELSYPFRAYGEGLLRLLASASPLPPSANIAAIHSSTSQNSQNRVLSITLAPSPDPNLPPSEKSQTPNMPDQPSPQEQLVCTIIGRHAWPIAMVLIPALIV